MRTPLYERHKSLGAKIVDFAGWEMPIHYEGVLKEHMVVRESCGLFDVSHMGVIEVKGKEAIPFLEWITTGTFSKKKPQSSTYTLFCNESGGTVDDLLVYKWDSESFYLVVNASNREKDFSHLEKYAAEYDVKVSREDTAILALQGPNSDQILRILYPDLPPIDLRMCVEYQDMVISRTGYTGEEGVEIYLTPEKVVPLFDALLEKGAIPCGLGARDTLRLEMGYALYGHELSDTISPLESVAAWAVKMNKPDFLGKEALCQKRFPLAIQLNEGGIPRQGDLLFKNNLEIGMVTSGNFSPMQKKGIALALCNAPKSVGEEIYIEIRSKKVRGQVVDLPFYNKG